MTFANVADIVAPVLCLIQCHRCKSALTCAAWQWNYVARPRDNYVAPCGCKLIPSDSWHSATLMMHTINLGKLTNRLNKLRDKSNLHHIYLIEIFPLKIEAQLNVGKVLDVTMLAKIVEMLILSPITISFPCEWGQCRVYNKDSLETKNTQAYRPHQFETINYWY